MSLINLKKKVMEHILFENISFFISKPLTVQLRSNLYLMVGSWPNWVLCRCYVVCFMERKQETVACNRI